MPRPPELASASRRSILLSILAATVATLAVTCRLVWPLPLHVQSMHAVTPFGDGHVWIFDQMARFLTGRQPFATTTDAAGFPSTLDARFLGWGPGLLALPLRAVLDAVGAYNVVFLLTPTLATIAAWLLLREVTRCGPWVAAAAAVPYGLCPYAIASLTNGQIEKAQLWVYPLYLWLLLRAIGGPRRALALAGLPVVTLAAVFTCPYFGLVLPLLAVPLAVGFGAWRSWRGGDGLRPLLAAGLALGLTAAAEAPARAYYGTALPGAPIESMFRPASTPSAVDGYSRRFHNSPSAEPESTLFRPTTLVRGDTNHVTYLLLPLWVVAGLGLLVRAPGRLTGLSLLGIGLTIAVGPQLVVDGLYVIRGGHPVRLPMAMLEATDYPLRYGGQYYRAIAVASLGLAVLMASTLSRLPLRWSGFVAALVAVACVGDLLQTWNRLTPWPTEPVAGREALARLGDNKGAVLALPFLGPQTTGSYGLLQATLHHRPTSAVARIVRANEATMYAPWITRLPAAAAARTIPELLGGLGFRYAVLTVSQVRAPDPDLPELSSAALTATFGPPLHGDGVLIWDFGKRE